jgi:hypothetical protein
MKKCFVISISNCAKDTKNYFDSKDFLKPTMVDSVVVDITLLESPCMTIIIQPGLKISQKQPRISCAIEIGKP